MELDDIWLDTCAVFRRDVCEDVADLWLAQLRPAGVAGETFFLTGPERVRGWIELRYSRALAECLRAVARAELAISLVAPDALPDALRAAESDEGSRSARAFEACPSTDLNPRYTFSQFVIGASNHVAHAAALAVAEQPAQAFNPLFIYGDPGVGKTHLAHAIANFVRAHAPDLTARYMTAENFASAFRSVLRDGTIGDFKDALRTTDILLIDDVQFLQSKAKTEEEFFHTVNALHESGRQLVITCDRTPRELDGLANRLRERFEAGLVVEIERPDLALRTAVLRKRVATDNIPLSDERALSRIAGRAPDNLRSLEGALIRVSAFASMRRQPLTGELVDELLDALHPRERAARTPTVRDVQACVADDFGVSIAEMLGPSRERRLASPRQLAMYLACELTADSLSTIAAAFSRDHSTVVHARDKLTRACEDDPALACIADRLRRVINNPPDEPRAAAASSATVNAEAPQKRRRTLHNRP